MIVRDRSMLRGMDGRSSADLSILSLVLDEFVFSDGAWDLLGWTGSVMATGTT